MKQIPQRELRNDSARILREAEAGQQFVITVGGRPVAMLGPYHKRRWVPAEVVRSILRTPTDPGILDDVRAHQDDDVSDPWSL